MDTYSFLQLERRPNGVAVLTINRPEKLNALNPDVLEELGFCFEALEKDDAVQGIILTGAGPKSFVAGADISIFIHLDPDVGKDFALEGQAVLSQIESMPKPVLAAVNGFALGGGCELAMACHLRMASENAIFGLPEVKLGLIPGYGGTQRLPRLVGRGRALELVLLGEPISAQRAFDIGLVNWVVPQEELIEKAEANLLKILERAPIAVRNALEAVYVSDELLEEGLTYEAGLFGDTCMTADFKEGVQAFLERRPAQFQGK